MLTVTFSDELEVNAVTDALNRLVQAESAKLARLGYIRNHMIPDDDADALRDNAFAQEASRAAIRHAMRAQLQIAGALPDPEYPADATVAVLDQVEAVVIAYQGEGR